MAEPELMEVSPADVEMIERIDALRVRVYREEVPAARDIETLIDEFDREARHWVVTLEGRLVASARLSVHDSLETVPDPEVYDGVFLVPLPTPIASFNRLVVAPEVRGRGISVSLDRTRLRVAEEMGCACAVGATAAGEHRVSQMLKSGFVIVGRGNRDFHPPWSYLPPPVILVCQLPRQKDGVEYQRPGEDPRLATS